jgi:putative tRNA adenosine deaminase-associated protein
MLATGGTLVASINYLLEREDEWFAFVRADGTDDLRVFVSDAVAAAESRYAELFAELPPPARRGAAAATGDDEQEDDDEVEAEEVAVVAPTVPGAVVEDLWAGDADLLADLGAPADLLTRLAVSGEDPSAATVEVGEVLGFAEALESLR